MNIVAFFHAWKFTHFDTSKVRKTANPKKLTSPQKLQLLLFGVNNPRPVNTALPAANFQTIRLKSNREIECWQVTVPQPKGTVILFHGYMGNKSSLLDKSEVFNQLGFNTLLVDFMGSGGSEGNQTTIGALEAEQVTSCFEYMIRSGEKRVYLFGTSMGAVAVMKAVHDSYIAPAGIIVECPFGTMYQTVCARFSAMHAPTFPMAGLLVFWGGIQNGFWAFGHNPVQYAKKINCPTLLMYGAKDERVSRQEIDQVYQNLAGEKKFIIFTEAGHESYVARFAAQWTDAVVRFLKE